MTPRITSIVVCETTGHWAAALRKELPPGVSLVEMRSLSELWQQCDVCPPKFVALELTEKKLEPMLAALLRIGREFPQVMPMIVAARKLSCWENVAREAGAVHFIDSPRRLPEVGKIVRCLAGNLAAFNADGCEDGQSIEERIFATLPWGQ